MTVVARVALLIASVTALAGCGGSQSLAADQSVHITAPAPLATVSAPFTASWTSSARPGRSYAVFIDRAPIPPGHTMRDLASDECRRRPDCVNANYLADRGVFVTTATEVTVPSLRLLAGIAAAKARPVHTLTIVLMDGRGRRVGDAAWQGEFRA